MAKLTTKRDLFAQAIVSGKSNADAYRLAFNAENMQADTIRKRASELMQNGDVKGRIEELRKPVIEQIQLSLKQHLEDLKNLRDLSTESEKFGPAIQAEIARGKASGLYVEQVKHTGTIILQLSSEDEDL